MLKFFLSPLNGAELRRPQTGRHQSAPEVQQSPCRDSSVQGRHEDCHPKWPSSWDSAGATALRQWEAVCSMAFPRGLLGTEVWQRQGHKPSLSHQTFNHNPLFSSPHELCQDHMNLTAGIFCLPLLEAGNGHGMRSHHETLPGQAAPRISKHTCPDEWCVFAAISAPFVPKISARGIGFRPSPQLWDAQVYGCGRRVFLRRWPRKTLGLRISQKANF